jgi:hypothetical protein
VPFFSVVKRNRVSVMAAVLRIVFKALVEALRAHTHIGARGAAQLQTDVLALKACIPQYIPHDDRHVLEQLLDEAVSSGFDRVAAATLGSGKA